MTDRINSLLKLKGDPNFSTTFHTDEILKWNDRGASLLKKNSLKFIFQLKSLIIPCDLQAEKVVVEWQNDRGDKSVLWKRGRV